MGALNFLTKMKVQNIKSNCNKNIQKKEPDKEVFLDDEED